MRWTRGKGTRGICQINGTMQTEIVVHMHYMVHGKTTKHNAENNLQKHLIIIIIIIILTERA